MKWEVLYGDWSVYDSDNYSWEEIPYDNVQKVFAITPTGHKNISSGVDKYVLQEVRGEKGEGIRLTWWKDENPEEKDPYYMKGRSMIFWDDNTTTEDTGYLPVSELKKGIPDKLIKRGKYLDEKTAKQMGIL